MVHRRIFATETGRYGTRMLTAGDAMTVTGPRARALIALGLASERKPRKPKPQLDHDGDGRPGGSLKRAVPPPPPPPAPPAAGELSTLRKAYEEKFGKKPSPAWKADTLAEKIAAA